MSPSWKKPFAVETYAHRWARAHQERADLWRRVHLGLGIPSVALAAIAGTSALAEFDGSNLVAGALALLVAALTGVSTFLDPGQAAQTHGAAARDFMALSGKLSRFRNLDLPRSEDEQDGPDALRETVRELSVELDDLKARPPSVPARYLSRWAEEDEANEKLGEVFGALFRTPS